MNQHRKPPTSDSSQSRDHRYRIPHRTDRQDRHIGIRRRLRSCGRVPPKGSRLSKKRKTAPELRPRPAERIAPVGHWWAGRPRHPMRCVPHPPASASGLRCSGHAPSQSAPDFFARLRNCGHAPPKKRACYAFFVFNSQFEAFGAKRDPSMYGNDKNTISDAPS